MTSNLAAVPIISIGDIFRAPALKSVRRNPGSAPRRGRRPAIARPWVERVAAGTGAGALARLRIFGYNPVLALGVAFLSGRVAKGKSKHAPGRFHSGAQVVKETEQAAEHHASRRGCESGVRPGSALPVSDINITGNPHD